MCSAADGVAVVGVTQRPKEPVSVDVFDSLRDDATICVSAIPVNEQGQRRCLTVGELRALVFKK